MLMVGGRPQGGRGSGLRGQGRSKTLIFLWTAYMD